LRIVGGAVAVGVPLSFWLLAFSMFLFLSLAMLKRYTELHGLAASGVEQAAGRGYAGDDLSLLQSLGGSAGYLAVLVLALYINSEDSVALYSRPQVLWLLCPLLLYWISRAWSLARRGRMHDDPTVFAATDRVSLATAAMFAMVLLGAIWRCRSPGAATRRCSTRPWSGWATARPRPPPAPAARRPPP